MMTSPRPPRLRDTRNLADLLRQDKQNLRQLDPGLVGGRFPPARPLKPAISADLENDDLDDLILFSNTDTGTCPGDGQAVTINLSHVPEDGSEQVFYNGTPLKRTDWYRTDTVLTIPAAPWFRSGKVAWVDYAYYDADLGITPPSLVGYTTISTNHTSIAIPAGTQSGDLLVLVLASRATATCSDTRFDAGYHHQASNLYEIGIWFGVADGSGSPVAINLDSTAIDGGADCCAALAAFTGSPMTVTSEATSSATSAPFTPALPAAGSFGVAGLAMMSGLVSGSISDESTAAWTTVCRQVGAGAGKTSVYIGYCPTGIPSGTWNSTGGSDHIDARIGGVQ